VTKSNDIDQKTSKRNSLKTKKANINKKEKYLINHRLTMTMNLTKQVILLLGLTGRIII
jgi:hypothetical protein